MGNRLSSLTVVGLLVISGFFIFATSESDVVMAGDIIYVGSGFGNDSATITGGIGLAQPGDTVFVYSGTYYENVNIDRTINLTGENKLTTIIDGGNSGYGIQINAQNNVNISGFTIQKSSTYAIYIVSSTYCRIKDNIITKNSGEGIFLFWLSDNNTIENNIIENNSQDAIELNSNCDYNVIANNTIEKHVSYGILLSNTHAHNNITNNKINDSNIGIYVWNTNTDNTIVGNTVSNSSFYGIYLWSANSNNRIYHNNILNNANQVYDDGTNSWDNGYPGGGNFWGDYSGGDNRSGPGQSIPGNDGIGDVGYSIFGGGNVDNYPLWPNWDALGLYQPSPDQKEVCEYAMGSVKVAVIFMESNGSIDAESENWSSSRKSTVISEIQDALTWWEGLEPNASLTFSILNVGSKETSYEPITHPHTNDSVWIGEIMDSMGYTSGNFLEKVQGYNHWIQGQYNTDWAYTILVADSFNDTDGNFSDPPWCAWAYWEYGCMVMTYDNGEWGIGRMNSVTAHETGHMFYATDEYQIPGERSGYLNALEGNQPGHLMYDNTLNLSSGTKLQIGWRDMDNDGIMDILDTEPNTHLISYKPDPTMDNTPSYTGYAVVVPYPNNNPSGSGRDVTLNTIANVEFRVDYGLWTNAIPTDGIFDEPVETFTFTVSKLDSGVHFIEARAINSVNNNDSTYANDTITIIPDTIPPEIVDTTIDIPVTGDNYNITADVTDIADVDTVCLEFTITSYEGYSVTINISMSKSVEPSYWYIVSIWTNTTWFNYSIKANDTSDNWNETTSRNLNFRVHNLDTGESFLKIQTAIDDLDTLDGHTISVENGIYQENVIVNKGVDLIGENRDNTIIDATQNGEAIYISADGVTISGFTITNNTGGTWDDAGIILDSVQNCMVSDNNVVSNDWHGIVVATFSSNNQIIGNNISNNKYGITIYRSSFNTIMGNNVSLNAWGIHIQLADDNTISDNTVSSNGYIGIGLVEGSSNNNITVNKVSHSDYGILLEYFLSSNNITNNDVLNNDYGIFINDSASSNTVVNNTVLSNLYGICVYSSSGNRIYHNNIINNTNQAEDDQSDNYWDDGYPSGGNFWSDYTGVDRFKGPNQNIPGNDGIGDTNYSIDSDSVDNYPLMGPIGDYIFLYEGWNLITIPRIQSNTDLDTVLSSISGSYDTVEWYNISDNSDHWKINNTSKPFYLNDFDNIDHFKGFWIHVIKPGGVLFEYPGTQLIENQTINLYPGWNLVSYPSLSGYTRTEGLNNLTFGTEVDYIWTFNAAAQVWEEVRDVDHFIVGRGYWFFVTTDCQWEVPL